MIGARPVPMARIPPVRSRSRGLVTSSLSFAVPSYLPSVARAARRRRSHPRASWARAWGTELGDRVDVIAGGPTHSVRIRNKDDAASLACTEMTGVRPVAPSGPASGRRRPTATGSASRVAWIRPPFWPGGPHSDQPTPGRIQRDRPHCCCTPDFAAAQSSSRGLTEADELAGRSRPGCC